MTVKTIKLCLGHKGGFGLFKAMSPTAAYKVVVVGRESCV